VVIGEPTAEADLNALPTIDILANTQIKVQMLPAANYSLKAVQ
jgi:hypothetical protein